MGTPSEHQLPVLHLPQISKIRQPLKTLHAQIVQALLRPTIRSSGRAAPKPSARTHLRGHPITSKSGIVASISATVQFKTHGIKQRFHSDSAATQIKQQGSANLFDPTCNKADSSPTVGSQPPMASRLHHAPVTSERMPDLDRWPISGQRAPSCEPISMDVPSQAISKRAAPKSKQQRTMRSTTQHHGPAITSPRSISRRDLQGSNGRPTRKQQAAPGATSISQFGNLIGMAAIKGKSMARWATLKSQTM
ncbi:hypothetical protein ACLOJK_018695 [Asimina triloba]